MRLNIAPRLTLCFGLILLAMLAGDGVVLWQFHALRARAEDLSRADQRLVTVLRVHSSLLSLHDSLELLADSENANSLVAEARLLNAAVLENTQRARSALESLPPELRHDPSLLPTLQIIPQTLGSQLQTISSLAAAGDWTAVRLRLAYQIHPLETLTSSMVERVDREVAAEQDDTVREIDRLQRRVFLLVPLTVLLTFFIAATLGLAITRSITQPLDRLVEGSRRLARGEFDSDVPVHGDDEIAHLARVFNDTSHRLRDLYASLQSSEDRLRRVIDTIPAFVWSNHRDGPVDYANRYLVEFTGRSVEQLLGWGWMSVLHPEDLPHYLEAWHSALASGQSVDIEARILQSSGSYSWLLMRKVPLRDDAGNIIQWYGVGLEIDDRKRAEEQLRRSEERWRDVFENNPIMYFMVDARGFVMAVNPFGAEQLGYSATELVGQPVLAVFATHERLAVQQNIELCFQELGRARSWEAFKVRRDGSTLRVRETAKAVQRVDGPIVLIACEDITEQRRAEDALRRAQSDLAHVNRVTTMGELTASLAHEVNQPIAAAVINAHACLHWLRRDLPDIEEAATHALKMIKDAKRASEIISRIRSFYQKGTAQPELIDVNELVREMILLLRGEASHSAISVRADLSERLPAIYGDRVQLQQVLMNLMVNSIDAMKSVDDTRELLLRTEIADDRHLLISVSDTGVGIPSQQAGQIFDAFFTTKPHGTGMGLRISRSIIESHGGCLRALPNFPRGARFEFTLPLPQAVPTTEPTHALSR